MNDTAQLCYCGKPLHYSDPAMREAVQRMVNRLGEYIIVVVGKRRFKIPRHYIALHGLRAWQVAKLGFEQVEESHSGNASAR